MTSICQYKTSPITDASNAVHRAIESMTLALAALDTIGDAHADDRYVLRDMIVSARRMSSRLNLKSIEAMGCIKP